MSIYLIFFLIIGMLAIIFYSFWMVDSTLSLRFKFKKSFLIKDSNLLYKNRTYSANKEQNFLKQESVLHIFNNTNRGIVQKQGAVVAYNSPGRFLLLIRWKILVVLRYAFVDR